MKKTVIYFLIICILICFVYSPALATAQTLDSETISANSCHGIDATGALLGVQKIVDNAEAVVLYEATSDTLMHTWNADQRMYPASFVKIMTALIAAESGRQEELVTVTEEAIAALPQSAVSADLVPGEQLTLIELLYCLLVGSANDAAAVIAEHIGGSQSAFVQVMNDKAKELGCTGTQFANAHGLHDEAQYTTARDAARILNAAMSNDLFRTVFTTYSHMVPATNMSSERALISGNSLMDTTSKLYYDARVIGGRTGVTEDGRRCLASVAENNGMQMICIVMGSKTVYQEDGYSAIAVGGYHETTELLDKGLDGYKAVQILFANQSLRQVAVSDGDSDVVMGPQISVSAVLPETVTMNDLSMRYSDEAVQAPITPGQRISSVEIWHGNMCVAQAELFAMNSVRQKNSIITSVEEQTNDEAWKTVVLVAICILFVLALIIFVPRFVKRMRLLIVRNRSKQYRRNRRRSR